MPSRRNVRAKPSKPSSSKTTKDRGDVPTTSSGTSSNKIPSPNDTCAVNDVDACGAITCVWAGVKRSGIKCLCDHIGRVVRTEADAVKIAKLVRDDVHLNLRARQDVQMDWKVTLQWWAATEESAGNEHAMRVVCREEFLQVYEDGETFVAKVLNVHKRMHLKDVPDAFHAQRWLDHVATVFINSERECKHYLYASNNEYHGDSPEDLTFGYFHGGLHRQMIEFYFGFARDMLLNLAKQATISDECMNYACGFSIVKMLHILHSLAHARLPYYERDVERLEDEEYNSLARHTRSVPTRLDATAYEFTHMVLFQRDNWFIRKEKNDYEQSLSVFVLQLYNDVHTLMPLDKERGADSEQSLRRCTHIRSYATGLLRQIIRSDVGLFHMQQNVTRHDTGDALLQTACTNLINSISILTGEKVSEEVYNAVFTIHRLLTGTAYDDHNVTKDAIGNVMNEADCNGFSTCECRGCTRVLDARKFNELFMNHLMKMDGEKREQFIKSLLDLLDPHGVNIGDSKDITGPVLEILNVILEDDSRLSHSLSEVAVAHFCRRIGVLFKHAGFGGKIATPKPFSDRFGANAPHWHDYVQGMEVYHDEAMWPSGVIVHFGVEILSKIFRVARSEGAVCAVCSPPPPILSGAIQILLDGILGCMYYANSRTYFPVLRLIPEVMTRLQVPNELMFCVDAETGEFLTKTFVGDCEYAAFVGRGKMQLLVYALQLAIARKPISIGLCDVREEYTEARYEEVRHNKAKYEDIGYFTGRDTPFEFAKTSFMKEQKATMETVDKCVARLRANGFACQKDLRCFTGVINVEDATSNYQLDAALACYALQDRMRLLDELTNIEMEDDWHNAQLNEPFIRFGDVNSRKKWGVEFNGRAWSPTLDAKYDVMKETEELQLSLPLIDTRWFDDVSRNPGTLDRVRLEIFDGMLEFYNACAAEIGLKQEGHIPTTDMLRLKEMFDWVNLERLFPIFDESLLRLSRAIKTLRRVWRNEYSCMAILLRGSFCGPYYLDMPDEHGQEFCWLVGWLKRNLALFHHLSVLFAERPNRSRYERKRLRVLEVMKEITEAFGDFFDEDVAARLYMFHPIMSDVVCSVMTYVLDHDFYLAPYIARGKEPNRSYLPAPHCYPCLRARETLDMVSILLINAAKPFAARDRLLSMDAVIGAYNVGETAFLNAMYEFDDIRIVSVDKKGRDDPTSEDYCGDPAVLRSMLKLSSTCLDTFRKVLKMDEFLRINLINRGLMDKYCDDVNACSIVPQGLETATSNMLKKTPNVLRILTACVSAPLHLTEHLDDIHQSTGPPPMAMHIRLLFEVSSAASDLFAQFFGFRDNQDVPTVECSFFRDRKGDAADFVNRLGAVMLLLNKSKFEPLAIRVNTVRTGKNPWKTWGIDFGVMTYQLALFRILLHKHTAFFMEHVPSVISCVINAFDLSINTMQSALMTTHVLLTLSTSSSIPNLSVIVEPAAEKLSVTKYASRLVSRYPRAKILKCHLLRLIYELAPSKDHKWLRTRMGGAKMGNVSELDTAEKAFVFSELQRMRGDHHPLQGDVPECWWTLLKTIEKLCQLRPWRHFLLGIDEGDALSHADAQTTGKALASLVYLSASANSTLPGSSSLGGLQCLLSLAGYLHHPYVSQLQHRYFEVGSDPSSVSAVLKLLHANMDIFCSTSGLFSCVQRDPPYFAHTADSPLIIPKYTSFGAKMAAELTSLIFSRLTNIGEEIVEDLYRNRIDRVQAIRDNARDMLVGVTMSGNNYASLGAHILFLIDKRMTPYVNYLPRQNLSAVSSDCVERAMIIRSLMRGNLGPEAGHPGDPSMRFQTELVVVASREAPLYDVCTMCITPGSQMDQEPWHGVQVKFKNELGEGAGVRREWFCIIGEAATNLDLPLLISYDGATVHPHPNVQDLGDTDQTSRSYFFALGRIAGLALYHGEILPIRFSEAFAFSVICVNQLELCNELGCYDNPDNTALNLHATIEEKWNSPGFVLRDMFWKLDPVFCEQIEKSVLHATADELEALDLTFTDTYDFTAGKGGIGHKREHYDLLRPLIDFRSKNPETKTFPPGYSRDMKGGVDVKVTIENRYHYVRWLAWSRCFGRCLAEACEFRSGMTSILGTDTHATVGKLFTPKEFTELLAGKETISIKEWRKFTEYDKLDDWPKFSESYTVQVFWKSLEMSSQTELMHILEFVTGLKRPPVAGFKNLSGLLGDTQRFTLGALAAPSRYDKGALPKAHTCFNTLRLPFFQPPGDSVTPEEKEKIMLDDAFNMLEKLAVVCGAARRGFDNF